VVSFRLRDYLHLFDGRFCDTRYRVDVTECFMHIIYYFFFVSRWRFFPKLLSWDDVDFYLIYGWFLHGLGFGVQVTWSSMTRWTGEGG